MDVRIEKLSTPDGRYAERRVSEAVDCDSCGNHFESEKVIEQWEEDRPLNLKQRVRERSKPCVYERVVETIENDEVVDVKVESVEPASQLQLVEHLGLDRSAKAPESEFVTKDELQEVIVGAVEKVKGSKPKRRMQAVVEDDEEEQETWGTVHWVLLAVIGVELAYAVVNILPRFFGA
jgi:hypothetical protein